MLHATTLTTPDGPFSILAADDAVLASGWTEDLAALLALVHPTLRGPGRTDPPAPSSAPEGVLEEAAAAVAAYYDGDHDAPGRVPVRQASGPFRAHAWDVLRKVKAGERLTYTQYATRAGRPAAVRAAAGACAMNAAALFVPCHRILRTDGSLGVGGGGSALDRACQEAADEVPLQRQEHDERDDHRDERTGRQHVPVTTARTRELRDTHRERERVRLAHDQGDQQVVPHPQELEDAERRERGREERQHDPEEHLHVAGAVHAGRLDQRGRDVLHEVVQQERGQRQREGRVRQPDRPERAVDPQVDVGRQQRHERDLDGHDLQGEHRDEQEVAALEVDPREAVRGQQRDGDRDEHGRQRHHERVDEVGGQVRRAVEQRGLVVAQREHALAGQGVAEDGPPAAAPHVELRAERRDEETDGRDGPQDRDDDGERARPRVGQGLTRLARPVAHRRRARRPRHLGRGGCCLHGAHRTSSDRRCCRTL
ncbi:methylated-DNA--[protein]-cysteine S-methyltransferase [Promicromonospora citrea]|nr:methylated-DNA--[protein]-cysteine S-methyltransferase [Promicromonospora citrea]